MEMRFDDDEGKIMDEYRNGSMCGDEGEICKEI